MLISSATKSIRKALAEALLIAAKQAEEQTNKKLNTLPEYFINMKIADAVFKRFPQSYKYSLEDSLQEVCQEIGMGNDFLDEIEPEFRLTGSARTDLVLRSKKGKIRHLVELKRSLNTTQIKKDALRLAAICAYAPAGHRIEKNFLLAISTFGPSIFERRTENIIGWLSEYGLNDINVQFELVDLSFHTSQRATSFEKPLCGGVWQFEYKY